MKMRAPTHLKDLQRYFRYSCERIQPSANLAAKRQQKLAQGVSPGFDFRSDTSREAAADAANLAPLRGSDMDKHEPQRARWAIFSRRFAAWATRPDAPGYLSVAASRRNNSFTPSHTAATVPIAPDV